ncbi:NAD(P)-dependent dehydrogenase (short-subunit alcohol dehydrogenase family) [Pseudomonas protegens]|uniref:Oxidoreductase, short chain dehydrogenase/reductase family n=1 Tax=Pseudomonas protegens (strain DSM 19095 / LMG 27888 / CFBP 6595 / CHA0) TaxID=1124983 RepID=A0A2C9END3_PSEPH|nr:MULTISPECIES: SDR family oxidoreductase [Pseudomonas]AGL85182.1 oxidoreductase, short chain dehydrogenase/reductase family [Pseudomonas protegens CHA0]MBP5111394.1 SDR family oxidoreductase [Pseudomonas protegens]MCS4258834.1 NAD(P)-dependent dehydrogenase (short-subunit alcohol dehydrogenase family) [Pseudomonas sp. BIGb0176]QTU23410.1 SDR family oxidoreductase [Pseudomonas protegens]QTU32942.1 SDR family oxidoreductase [Pseudomonas protegens]
MTLSNSSLARQTLVVIGAGSGIGAAVTRQAAARGARVVLAGRSLEALQRQQAQLPESACSIAVDITDTASLQALFARVGAFDHLVISAGPAIAAKPLADTDLLDAQRAFEVKFWGVWRAVQAALPTLAPQGSISLTSGLLSRKMVPGQVLKTTLNAALEALGKHLAKELAPRRVNVISPGVTATEAYAGMPEDAREAMFARTGANLPVGRVGQPDEVAAAFILAMENGFISGSLIDVDGGGLL